MKIVVLGAGQVGATIVEALHEDHDVTVVDLDAARLQALSYRHDIRTVEGNGATRRVLQEAGIDLADLMIACTSRDEINLVAATLAKKLSDAQTIVRTSNPEYIEAWQERQIEVDFMVSSELETAHAVSRTIGLPAAKQTDVFADGQVQIVEFDVPRAGRASGIPPRGRERWPAGPVGRLRDRRQAAPRGEHSRRLEGGKHHPRRPDVCTARRRVDPAGRSDRHHRLPGRRTGMERIMARGERPVDDVVIFGAGADRPGDRPRPPRPAASASGSSSLARSARARSPRSCRTLASTSATGIDPDFIERERIGQAERGRLRHARGLQEPLCGHAGASARRRLHDRHRPRACLDRGVRARRHRRGRQPPLGDRRGDRPLRARPARSASSRCSRATASRSSTSPCATRASSCGGRSRSCPMTGSLIGAIVRDGSAHLPARRRPARARRPGDHLHRVEQGGGGRAARYELGRGVGFGGA